MIIRKGLVFFIILVSSGFLFLPQNSSAQVPKDPFIEYHYNIKVDISWIHTTLGRILDISDLNWEQEAELEKISQQILQNPFFTSFNTFEVSCELKQDKLVANAFVEFSDTATENADISAFLYASPKPSIVRAVIPEDETLIWLSITDPGLMIPIFSKLFTEEKMETLTGDSDIHPIRHIREQLGFDLLKHAEKYLGDESHLILYDININPSSDQPEIQAACVSSLAENLSKDDLDYLAGMIDRILLEKYGATKAVSKWETFDAVIYSGFGCPVLSEIACIIDENFIIIANSSNSLKKTAGYVFMPPRTAQSGFPPVINAMATINIEKIMNLFPVELLLGLTDANGIDPHHGDLGKFISTEDWGMIRCVRTHTRDGILGEVSINRSVCSLLFHVWREIMVDVFRDELKSGINQKLREKEWKMRSKLQEIETALENFHTEHGVYPKDVGILLSEGFMKSYPVNVFTDKPMKNNPTLIVDPGDFSYFPKIDPESGKITGYWLIGYGAHALKNDRINNKLMMEEMIIKEEYDGEIDHVAAIIEK